VLPLVAICTVALIGMVALAIDLGMIAVARTQCQNAADSAAMAGARTINGNSTGNYNLSAVPTAAVTAAVANKIFGTNVQGSPGSISPNTALTDSQGNPYSFTSGQVQVDVGTYAFTYNDANPSQEGFGIQIPRIDTTEPYSAVRVTVSYTGNFSFGRVFGINTYNANAQSVAGHRPRDVVIVLDLSGSMRFQSLPGIPLTNSDIFGNSGTFGAASSLSAPRVVSMNPDPVVPLFGHYSSTAAAALVGTTNYQEYTGEQVDGAANISSTTNSGPPICADFFANPSGTAPGASNVAFTSVASSGTSAPSGGDNYLAKNGVGGSPPATYGQTVQDITNGKTFQGYQPTPFTGYSGGAVSTFQGYTQGPGYWGKTFFIWPPDPRGPAPTTDANNSANWANNGSSDWRRRFFLKYNTSTSTYGWLDHNNILFNPSGAPATQSSPNPTPILNTPMGTSGGTSTTVTENGASVTYKYKINYAAILFWLFDSSQNPNPFPTTLQGGRIRYYANVPNYNDTTLNTRWWAADLGTSTSGSALSNLDERFWKDYIDFVLGVQASGAGTYANTQNSVPYSALIGNGDYFAWGTVQIKDKPDPTDTSAYQTGKTTVAYSIGYTGVLLVNSVTDTPLVGDTVTFGTTTTNQYTIASITSAAGVYSITLNKALVAAVSSGTTVNFYPYMDYNDNPYRPRHQFWFGAMTMVDYLGNYNLGTGAGGVAHHWWPGNVHEAHSWACKVGVQTAIQDIRNNHPNDFVALAFFSSPKYSASGVGHHNRNVVPLGRSYQMLTDSLWFPPGTVTGSQTEITPYDSNLMEGPRADGGTCPGMGFMLAYNQLSSSTTNLRFYAQPSYQLPSSKTPNYRGDAGGLGRKGANRLVIFETDGFPNTRGTATIQNAGADSYYPIRIQNPANLSSASNVEWPSGGTYSNTEVYNMVQQICALTSASPPGYSTSRKPALVYCIGYGSIFDPGNKGQAQTTALTFLQTVQYYGNTSQDTNPANFPSWAMIYGTNANRIATMQQAFTNIMQAGVQVSLIQ
jgi:hypothetical protein